MIPSAPHCASIFTTKFIKTNKLVQSFVSLRDLMKAKKIPEDIQLVIDSHEKLNLTMSGSIIFQKHQVSNMGPSIPVCDVMVPLTHMDLKSLTNLNGEQDVRYIV